MDDDISDLPTLFSRKSDRKRLTDSTGFLLTTDDLAPHAPTDPFSPTSNPYNPSSKSSGTRVIAALRSALKGNRNRRWSSTVVPLESSARGALLPAHPRGSHGARLSLAAAAAAAVANSGQLRHCSSIGRRVSYTLSPQLLTPHRRGSGANKSSHSVPTTAETAATAAAAAAAHAVSVRRSTAAVRGMEGQQPREELKESGAGSGVPTCPGGGSGPGVPSSDMRGPAATIAPASASVLIPALAPPRTRWLCFRF